MVQDRAFDGSFSIYSNEGQVASGDTYFARRELDDTKPYYIEAYIQETQNSTGHGIRVFAENGQLIGVGTDNPEWQIYDANGRNQVYDNSGYDKWLRIRIQFDWNNNNADVTIEDLQSGTEKTFKDRPFKSVSGETQAFSIRASKTGNGDDVDGWWDYFLTSPFGFVFTNDATNVDTQTATLNGKLESVEGSSDDVFFEYRKQGNQAWNETSKITKSDTGSFSETVSGLSTDADYEFRAKSQTSDSTYSGQIKTFSTLKVLGDTTIFSDNVQGTITVDNNKQISSFPSYIRIEEGASNSGTGIVNIDGAKVNGREDIAVGDGNGNLLDFYFDQFDTQNEVYEIWVLDDIVRDGSHQITLYFGNGNNDKSLTESTFWNKVSGIQARYGFNESSGDTLFESTGNYDGAHQDNPSLQESGQMGSAYNFDNQNDWIDLPQVMDGSEEEITYIMWFNPDTLDSSNHMIFDFWSFGASCGIAIRSDGNQAIESIVQDGGYTLKSSGSISTGVWHHHFGVADSTNSDTFRIDMNSPYATMNQSVSFSCLDSGDYAFAEDSEDSGRYYDGLLDEVQVYDVAKSQAFGQANYDMSKRANYSLYSWNVSSTSDGGGSQPSIERGGNRQFRVVPD